jgi:hypothetical protein
MAMTQSGTELEEWLVQDRSTWESYVQGGPVEGVIGEFDYEETGYEHITFSPGRKVAIGLVGKLVDGRVATDVVVSVSDENVLVRSEVVDLIALLTRSLDFLGPDDV